MNLVASLIVRNELGRYLEPCVQSLLEFCDEVRVWDDCSDDGTYEWLLCQDRVAVGLEPAPSFFQHEGRARNRALRWAMDGKPTHILAVDADEFVTDGAAIRLACGNDQGPGVWSLDLEEVWKADERSLRIREDGSWNLQERGIPILWRVPLGRIAHSHRWQVLDMQLACGRAPTAVSTSRRIPSGSGLLHFGWACEADRAARYQRYVDHDGGRFHRDKHIKSIMFPDRDVKLRKRPWPANLDRPAILDRVRQGVPA